MTWQLVAGRRVPHKLLPGVACYHPYVAPGVLKENGQWHDVCRECGAYWPEEPKNRGALAPWPQVGNPLATTPFSDAVDSPEYREIQRKFAELEIKAPEAPEFD